jgi:hypothetical protein
MINGFHGTEVFMAHILQEWLMDPRAAALVPRDHHQLQTMITDKKTKPWRLKWPTDN